MNLTRFLPHFGKSDDVAEPTADELDALDADAKKARIKHHRDSVRNGPVKTRPVTNGQQRRFVERSKRARNRKVNKNYRTDYARAQRDIAVLRGQLVTLAAIKTSRRHLDVVTTPYTDADGATYLIDRDVEKTSELFLVGQSPDLMRNALQGLFDHYGPVVQAALDEKNGHRLDFEIQEHRDLVVAAAVHHYGLATGQAAA